MVALIGYGSQQIANQSLTHGGIHAFIAAAFLMYGPIKRLSRVNASLQQAIAAAERIFELLDTHSEVRERRARRSLTQLRRRVEFRDVSFAYEDGAGKTC